MRILSRRSYAATLALLTAAGAMAGCSRKDPAAREMLGYLFVRSGVHAAAYAKALEKLTGADVTRMLPIPKIGNEVFPEAKK